MVFLVCWCFCLWLSVAIVRPSVGVGLSVSVLCLAVVGSLPLPVVASLPLAVGVLAQLSGWSLPLGIWLLSVTAWPCVGFVYLLHHDACVVRVLSITLRYSSADDPGPPLDTPKLHFCYFWQ